MNFFGCNQFDIIDCTLSADGRPRYHTLKQFFTILLRSCPQSRWLCSYHRYFPGMCFVPLPRITRHIFTVARKDHTLKAIFVRCKDVYMYWSKPERFALSLCGRCTGSNRDVYTFIVLKKICLNMTYIVINKAVKLIPITRHNQSVFV